VLYTVQLFPKTNDAVDPDRHHIAFNPDIEDVADFGCTIAWKHYVACARVPEVTYSIFSDIFHAAYPALARARSKFRWDKTEGWQMWSFSWSLSPISVVALAIVSKHLRQMESNVLSGFRL
jgi:hypothetical protein